MTFLTMHNDLLSINFLCVNQSFPIKDTKGSSRKYRYSLTCIDYMIYTECSLKLRLLELRLLELRFFEKLP